MLTFYRGAWCPYCNIALRSLQEHHDAITARGARLVAVSPQVADESLSLAEKHQLAFDVLGDVGSETAKQYGLAYDLPDDLAAVYDTLGKDLQRVNGGHSRTLPLPATYVIDRAGTIGWAPATSPPTPESLSPLRAPALFSPSCRCSRAADIPLQRPAHACALA